MDEEDDPEDAAGVETLYKCIEGNTQSDLDYYTNPKGLRLLLKFMGRPGKADGKDYPNMLICSIKRRSYLWASRFLEVLQHPDSETKALDLLSINDLENCFKSLLSSKPSHQLALAEQSSNGKQTSNNQESLFEKLLSFQDVVKSLVTNLDFFIWMLEQNLEAYVLRILNSSSLSPLERRDCLAQKVPNQNSLSKHVLEYNLFMLVFEKCRKTPSQDQFVKIVRSVERNHQCELILGQEETGFFSDSENCLRTAARNGKAELAMDMLLYFVPVEKQIKAILQVGPNGFSTWTQLLEADSQSQIKQFLTLGPSGEKRSDTFVETRAENLKKALQHPELKYFKHAKMSLEAIKLLTDHVFFKCPFLIPNPGLSQPFGLIFYNTFKGSENEIPFAKVEANDLCKAFQKLKWPKDSIVLYSDWTVGELHDKLDSEIVTREKNCSLFVLSIISHGSAGKVTGNDLTDGNLQLIIDKLGKLPEHIPKVAILDTCAVEDGSTESLAIELKTNNTLLLKSTVRGGISGTNSRYINHLASQIGEADGVTSLSDMHMEAAEWAKLCSIDDPSNVDDSRSSDSAASSVRPVYNRADNSSEATSANASIQVPEKASTARPICLPNFGQKYDKCQKCTKTVKKVSNSHITCQRCSAPHHLACVQLERRHMVALKAPGFMWFCSECYEAVRKSF